MGIQSSFARSVACLAAEFQREDACQRRSPAAGIERARPFRCVLRLDGVFWRSCIRQSTASGVSSPIRTLDRALDKLECAMNNASGDYVSTAAGTQLKVHTFLRLKVGEDAKQVLRRRIAIRPKHAHEAFAGIDVASSSCRKPSVALICCAGSRGPFSRRRRAKRRKGGGMGEGGGMEEGDRQPFPREAERTIRGFPERKRCPSPV